MKKTKSKKEIKKFVFSQNTELCSLTENDLISASPELVFKLAISTYFGLHHQLQIDALTKKTKTLEGQPVVDYFQSSLNRVEELYPGLLTEVRKQNSNFIFQC